MNYAKIKVYRTTEHLSHPLLRLLIHCNAFIIYNSLQTLKRLIEMLIKAYIRA